MAENKKYSHKGFPYHGLSFKAEPVEDFNNSEIVGSCFYQEWTGGDTMKDIFPLGMTGVTFIKCNLDNVFVPAGNIIDKTCTHKRIRVQNDMEDWEVGTDDKPTEPLHPKRYDDKTLSKDPLVLPENFIRKEELLLDEFNKIKTNPDFIQWWIGTPEIIETKQVKMDDEIKTVVVIEGSGYFMIDGIKPRPCLNVAITKPTSSLEVSG